MLFRKLRADPFTGTVPWYYWWPKPQGKRPRVRDHDRDGVPDALDYDHPHLRNADDDSDGIRNFLDHDWAGYKWVNPRGDHDGDNVMNSHDPNWTGKYGLKEHYQNTRKKYRSNSHTPPHEQDPQGYQQADEDLSDVNVEAIIQRVMGAPITDTGSSADFDFGDFSDVFVDITPVILAVVPVSPPPSPF